MNGQFGMNSPNGKDHTQFMDLAYQYGLKVIFPLMGDFTILMNTDDATLERYLRQQIDEVGNHSALLVTLYH